MRGWGGLAPPSGGLNGSLEEDLEVHLDHVLGWEGLGSAGRTLHTLAFVWNLFGKQRNVG